MTRKVSYLAQQIRRRRQALGLSQLKLSELSGIHRQVLAKLERGAQQDLYGENIARLARALHLTADELLGLDRSPNPALAVVNRYLASTLVVFDCPTKAEVAWLRGLDPSAWLADAPHDEMSVHDLLVWRRSAAFRNARFRLMRMEKGWSKAEDQAREDGK